MGGMWWYNCCFIGCCFQDLFKTASMCSFHQVFFFAGVSLKSKVVQPYNSTDTATFWKSSSFILSERSDFHMVVNQSIETQVLPMHMLTLLSADEIWDTLRVSDLLTMVSWLRSLTIILCKALFLIIFFIHFVFFLLIYF